MIGQGSASIRSPSDRRSRPWHKGWERRAAASSAGLTQTLAALGLIRLLARRPQFCLRLLARLSQTVRGLDYGQRYSDTAAKRAAPHDKKDSSDTAQNPLANFFESRVSGRGIWKWEHYFEIYDRHFRKFVGRRVNVLEIGVYSGGSIQMWQSYFGNKCHVYGIDIEESCREYEDTNTTILIGDQGDRSFWRQIKKLAPDIDIVIDDGGHSSEQQIISLEEMLPHIRPGGVYVCEDIHGLNKGFFSFAHGLSSHLNTMMFTDDALGSAGGITPTEFQTWVQSVHFYPYLAVFEKSLNPVRRFAAPRRGTEWQPFGARHGYTHLGGRGGD